MERDRPEEESEFVVEEELAGIKLAMGGCSPEQGRRKRAGRAGWPAGGGKRIKVNRQALLADWEEWKMIGGGRELSGRRGKWGSRGEGRCWLGTGES